MYVCVYMCSTFCVSDINWNSVSGLCRISFVVTGIKGTFVFNMKSRCYFYYKTADISWHDYPLICTVFKSKFSAPDESEYYHIFSFIKKKQKPHKPPFDDCLSLMGSSFHPPLSLLFSIRLIRLRACNLSTPRRDLVNIAVPRKALLVASVVAVTIKNPYSG